jgi:UDP-N-acetylmuramate--alanine ligase
MVFEADESDGSFLNSNPYCAIVTNAEPEHMEYYDYDLEWFHECYTDFLNKAAYRVINGEDEFLSQYAKKCEKLYPSKDIKNISYELRDGEPCTCFELRDFGKFCVWGFGEHIALDASLAILAASHELEIEDIRTNYALIDDYAHHPTEIEATIKSANEFARLSGFDTITAVWQPHKWSRTMDNLEHFRSCFVGVDKLFILPVWAVNEEPRELDFEGLFAAFGAKCVDRLKRNGDSIDFIIGDDVVASISKGLMIGFGAGDITYQLRGQK